MKKILIFTASMGSGHVTASRGINDMLKNKNTEIEIIDILEWTIFGRLSRWSFSFLGKYFPTFLEWIFHISSHKTPSWIDSIFYRLWIDKKKLAYCFSSHVQEVWVTFPALPLFIQKYWKQEIHIQVTDYMTPHLSWTWGERVCIHVLDEDSKKYVLQANPSAHVIIGNFPLPNEYTHAKNYSEIKKQEIRLNKKIPASQKVFLFFFHHVLFGNEHELVEKFLTSPKYKDYFGIIIAGNNYEIFKDLKGERIQIESWVSDIYEYYAIANAVCGKCGGAFVSEVILFDLPLCISGVFSGQEKGNKEFLEKQYSHSLIDL